MKIDEFIIFPSLEDALSALNAINRSKGFDVGVAWDIPQKVGCQVEGNGDTTRHFIKKPDNYLGDIFANSYQCVSGDTPASYMVNNYKIYDYLSDSAKRKFKDKSIIPHSIDYIKDITPRLHKKHIYDAGGLLSETIFYEWDFENNVPLSEILRTNETYTLADDSDYPAAQSVRMRRKERKWMTTNNYYVSGDTNEVKETVKIYDETNIIRREGKRRRENILNNVSEGMVYTMIILFDYWHPTPIDFPSISERQQESELFLTDFLMNFQLEESNYMISGRLLPQAVDSQDYTQLLYNSTNGDNIVYANVMLLTIPDIPQIYGNAFAQRGIGMTLKQFLVDSLKGLI